MSADFRALIVNGVALANSLTPSLQVAVTIRRAGVKGEFGDPVRTVTYTGKGLLSRESSLVRNSSGAEVKYKTKITILESVQVSEDDLVDYTDSDGITNRVIAVEGLVDPITAKPYLTKVYIG